MTLLQASCVPSRIEGRNRSAVFTPREIARAAGVHTAEVEALLAAGEIRTMGGPGGGFVAESEAIRTVRALARGLKGRAPLTIARGPATPSRRLVPSLAFSGTLHALIAAGLVAVTSLGLAGSESARRVAVRPEPIRMVYLMQPGPGGGGGGGGKLRLAPPPRAQRKAPKPRRVSSPMPPRRPPPPPVVVAERPVERPAPPPPPAAQPVAAPIATVPAEMQDRQGVMEETAAKNHSAGPGTLGGAGSGQGTGIGEGDGAGVGPGSGGGTGGGPYRAGSGIEPPQLLREVKPDYTEDARRRGIEGDVILEIVVRRDGSVGDVRVVERLGGGLDERAVSAVRQWRFAPARRRGAPVDVEVEVAVEFKLR